MRRQKLANGDFFMIIADDLPEGQCYIEYADGRIALVMLDDSKRDFVETRQLSVEESNTLRSRYELY